MAKRSRHSSLQSLRSLLARPAVSAAPAASAAKRKPAQRGHGNDDHALSEAASLFRRAVGPVQPLSESVHRALVEKPPPLPLPRQSALDDAAALHESQTAPFSIEDRLGSGEESAFLRPGLPRRVLTDLRRGRWVAQRALDLHSMNRDEARDAVAGLLAHSLERGIRCVRIIHGKGHGSPGRMPVLKHLLRGWLIQRNEILAFCQAPPRDGGGGALLILLSGTKQG